MTEIEASGSWIERHVNWSIAFAWLAVLGLAIGACGLQLKGRSFSWLFFLFIPFGFIVLFSLGNKSVVNQPEPIS
jgi:uncharacterized membrane protein